MATATTSALAGCLSANAAAASASVRGGSSRCRPSATGVPGSGRCSSHAVAVRAEKGGNADNQSSNANGKSQSQSRRELLAGSLAGTILLPGGAALGGVDSVLSGPLPAPDLSKCTTAFAIDPGQFPTECCPPDYTAPQKIIDFKPDKTIPFRIRPPLHTIDAAYVEKYNRAYKKMRDLPDSDPRSWYQQAKVHCAYCNGAFPLAKGLPGAVEQIHFGWYFFPFHRAELYFHERILAHLIEDPTFKLPFWNWDNQSLTAGANLIPPLINNKANPGLYDKKRNALHVPGGALPIVNLTYFGPANNYTSADQVRSDNLAEMYSSVTSALTAKEFLGGSSTLTASMNPAPSPGSPAPWRRRLTPASTSGAGTSPTTPSSMRTWGTLQPQHSTRSSSSCTGMWTGCGRFGAAVQPDGHRAACAECEAG